MTKAALVHEKAIRFVSRRKHCRVDILGNTWEARDDDLTVWAGDKSVRIYLGDALVYGWEMMDGRAQVAYTPDVIDMTLDRLINAMLLDELADA